MSIPKLFIVLTFTITVALCTLQVTNIAQLPILLQTAQLSNIPYSIANFGFAPTGKTMVARLIQAPNLSKECGTNSSEEYSKDIQNSFLLIPRGDCPFVTKAIHAQELGAKMAIIMDDADHTRGIIMKDNGYGYKVNIPAIFISHQAGKNLETILNETSNKVTLKIVFENIKTEMADVVLYTRALNRMSHFFIQQFQPFYKQIKNNINFRLVYDVIFCPECSVEDCYYDTKYCSVSYQHGLSANGKMILDQQLREQVVFQSYNDKWWGYMKCISQECNKIAQLQQCSSKCVKKQGIDPQKLKSEVTGSFNDNDKSNLYLQSNIQELRYAGVEAYPSVAINNVKVKGSISAEFIFDDICNSLISPPKVCQQYVTQVNTKVTSDKMYWITVILVLIFCSILFFALFVLCRRRLRSNMTAEMQGRVDDMVSKYIEFYSERNNRK